MSKALARPPSATVARARAGVLSHMLNEIAEDDVGVARAASRAREIDSIEHGQALLCLPKDELERQGWTREELRVAIDAKHASKDAPFYLRMSHERLTMRYRGQEGERPGGGAVIVLPDAPPAPAESDTTLPKLPEGEK